MVLWWFSQVLRWRLRATGSVPTLAFSRILGGSLVVSLATTRFQLRFNAAFGFEWIQYYVLRWWYCFYVGATCGHFAFVRFSYGSLSEFLSSSSVSVFCPTAFVLRLPTRVRFLPVYFLRYALVHSSVLESYCTRLSYRTFAAFARFYVGCLRCRILRNPSVAR